MVVDGWMDLRTERIDSTVGWMIGLDDMVDNKEAELLR